MLVRLAWRLVLARGAKHLVTVVIIALGVGLMTATGASVDAGRSAVSAVATSYPLVVGGDVGSVELVLGSLTRLEDVGGGVDHQLFQELEADPRVEVAVPLLMGHAVDGFTLLATSHDGLAPRERFPLVEGRLFEGGADEVVVGSHVATGLGVGLGDRVVIEHQHVGAPDDPGELVVVGVLAPTRSDADRTLYCPLEAIHRSHAAHAAHAGHHPAGEHEARAGHHPAGEHEAHAGHGSASRRLSSVLVRPIDRGALLSLQEELQARPGVQVALTGQTLRRVVDRVATGGRLLEVVVAGVVLITFLSLLLAVYGTTLTQAREIAVMRVLGARRLQIVAVIGLSTFAVVLTGVVLGLGLGGWLGGLAEVAMREQMGLDAQVDLLSPTTVQLLGVATFLLALAGIQPALAAYSLQAAEALGSVPGSGRASRSYLRASVPILVGLAVLVWLQIASSQHSAEVATAPLDPDSAALFQAMSGWSPGAVPSELAERAEQEQAVRGYMYALGDPFEVQDFYLVALNPRLPRCPFCYRSPTRRERILVRSERTHEVCGSLVEVRGRLVLEDGGEDPVQLVLSGFEVVVP